MSKKPHQPPRATMPLTGDQDAQIHFRVHAELKAKIEAAAKADGVPASLWMKRALRDAILARDESR